MGYLLSGTRFKAIHGSLGRRHPCRLTVPVSRYPTSPLEPGDSAIAKCTSFRSCHMLEHSIELSGTFRSSHIFEHSIGLRGPFRSSHVLKHSIELSGDMGGLLPETVSRHDCRDAGGRAMQEQLPRTSATERATDGLEACPRRKVHVSRRPVRTSRAIALYSTDRSCSFSHTYHVIHRQLIQQGP